MASVSVVTAGLLYPIVILGPDPMIHSQACQPRHTGGNGVDPRVKPEDDDGWFAGFGLTNHRSRPVSAFPHAEEPPFPAAQVLQALT